MLASGADARRVRVIGFWYRVLAGTVDLVLLVPLLMLFAAVTAAAGGREMRSVSEIGPSYLVELALEGGVGGMAALWMAALVGLLYFVVFHALRGQTLGERLLGIRVIDEWGETPSLPRVLLRTVAGVVSLAGGCLGFLWIAFDREKRGLHDWVAGTYVVRARMTRDGSEGSDKAAAETMAFKETVGESAAAEGTR